MNGKEEHLVLHNVFLTHIHTLSSIFSNLEITGEIPTRKQKKNQSAFPTESTGWARRNTNNNESSYELPHPNFKT